MSDLIDRQAVLKLLSTMPPEEAITKALLIQDVKQMDAAQPEKRMDERTETHACDLISRAAAIDALRTHERKPSKKWFDNQLDIEWNNAIDICCYDIEDLPSAQPKAIRPKFVAEDRYRKNLFQVFPHCPKCNYELETGDCYCRVCGCHIDWSEDDE